MIPEKLLFVFFELNLSRALHIQDLKGGRPTSGSIRNQSMQVRNRRKGQKGEGMCAARVLQVSLRRRSALPLYKRGLLLLRTLTPIQKALVRLPGRDARSMEYAA